MFNPFFYVALVLFSFSLISFIFTAFSVYKKLSFTPKPNGSSKKPPNSDSTPDPISKKNHSLVQTRGIVCQPNEIDSNDSLLLQVLPSVDEKGCEFEDGGDGILMGNEGQNGKKKKRKGKKKKGQNGNNNNLGGGLESVCVYPFTSSGSPMQRKIKQQYDELVKCHDSNKLTLPQVVQFANTLVKARNELQHKADAIKRKFVIKKASLFKADRSSFDRLCQQIHKLELEQKRLEEDTFVYNWLQEQLKLSPVYEKMLDVGTCMEKEKSFEFREDEENEYSEISFEELLAQEKKDWSFWQKAAKYRQCSS